MLRVDSPPLHWSGRSNPAVRWPSGRNRRAIHALRLEFKTAVPNPDWCEGARDQLLVALAHVPRWLGQPEAAASLVEQSLLARVCRHRFAAQQQQLLVAYALHRLVVSAAMGRPLDEVHLSRNRVGAPQVDGCPEWHTSLSHAGDFIAIGVCRGGRIGVDIEPWYRACEMPEIAGSVCAASELRSDIVMDERALLRLWVRKEALLKAEGVGLSRPMNAFAAPANMRLPSLSEPGTWLRIHEPDVGNQCALAVAGPEWLETQVAWLSPLPET